MSFSGLPQLSASFEAIFTDEPRLAGKVQGTTGILKEVNRILGYERTIANPIPGTTRDAIDTPITRNGKLILTA